MKTKSLIIALMMPIVMMAQAPERPMAPKPPKPSKEEMAKMEQEKKQKVEAMKVAFITTNVGLTPEEAKVFWPVYNEYDKKIEALRNEKKDGRKKAKKEIDSLSNKEVEAMVDGEMLFRQKELDLDKEYNAKFKAILPIKKVAKLYEAQDKFKRHLIQEMRGPKGDKKAKKMGMRGPNKPEGPEEMEAPMPPPHKERE